MYYINSYVPIIIIIVDNTSEAECAASEIIAPDDKFSIIRFDDKEYLVNTSGDIIKNKTNIKDEDGYYYCTDKDGIVTYK